MKKKLLFILAVFFGFMAPVYAEEITLTQDEDMNGEVFTIAEDITINGNGHTIKGTFSIPYNTKVKVVLKNLVIDGEGAAKILAMPQASTVGVSIEIDNVTFLNYTKTALELSGVVESLVVKNSTFDSASTVAIDGMECSDEKWCELEKRSASAIDLNFRGDRDGVDATEVCGDPVNIGEYNISNNIFKNVIIPDADLETSTAGAIKLKIKSGHGCLSSQPFVSIYDNQFINNSRDMVIGTGSVVGTSTTRAKSGDFDLYLKGNGVVNILNNAADATVAYADKLFTISEFESANMTSYLNYSNGVQLGLIGELGEEGGEVTPSVDINNVKLEDYLANHESLDFSKIALYDKNNLYIATLASSDIKDDLTNTVTDLSLKVSRETAIDKLKDYANGTNMFIESNESGALPFTKVSYKFATDFKAGSKAYLYYYSDKGLEKAGECVVDDSSYATFDLTHFSTYLISDVDLLNTNPATNLNIEVIIAVGALLAMFTILGISISKKKLNKQN